MKPLSHRELRSALAKALAPFGMATVRLEDVFVRSDVGRNVGYFTEMRIEASFAEEPVPGPDLSEFVPIVALADGRTLYVEVPEGTPVKAFVRPVDG